MQISKLLPAICAVAVCAGSISIRAQDNQAQAAARAALMEKMSEPDAPTAPTNTEAPPIIVTPSGAALEQQNPPAAIPTPPPAPPEPQPAPTVPAVAPIQTPEPAATMSPPPDNSNPVAPASSDNSAQAAARAALEQKMSQVQEPPPVEAPIETPAPATTMPVVTEPAPSPAPPVVPMVMPATNAIAAQPPVKPAKPADVKQAGNEPGFKPIIAPPLPISMTKEEQLQALLDKYKADQITPEEYFKQRAAILAEP
jgi:hypothetical protein